jgi:phospholipid transport system substrate-binding protein
MNMRNPVKILLSILISVVMSGSALAQNSRPIDIIQNTIDKTLTIMNDPQYESDAQQDQLQQKVWDVVRDVFDYNEIARRALARNWKQFTSAQRKEFTQVFSELLKNTYLNRLKREYKDTKFTYEGQELISETKAKVKTKLERKTLEAAVNYRMRYQNEKWRIYDITIEGVSMVKNYRSQFKEILTKESPAQLIERLKEKLKPRSTAIK